MHSASVTPTWDGPGAASFSGNGRETAEKTVQRGDVEGRVHMFDYKYAKRQQLPTNSSAPARSIVTSQRPGPDPSRSAAGRCGGANAPVAASGTRTAALLTQRQRVGAECSLRLMRPYEYSYAGTAHFFRFF